MNQIDTSYMLKRAHSLRKILTICLGVLGLIFAFIVGKILMDPQQLQAIFASQYGYTGVELRGWQLLALGGLAFVTYACWGAVFWLGRRVFKHLGAVEIMQSAAVAKRISWLLWGIVILSILGHTLGVLILTAHFPPGARALSISLEMGQLSTVLAALFASFIAQALVLGAELWQDHKEVI